MALARLKSALNSLKKVLLCEYLSNMTPIDDELTIEGFPISFGLMLLQRRALNLD